MGRSFNDILNDVCIIFGTDIIEYNNSRTKRKSTEKISLITQAFVYIILTTTCANVTQLAEYLKRSKSQISIAHTKAKTLLMLENNLYALDFKNKILTSCIEGEKSIKK